MGFVLRGLCGYASALALLAACAHAPTAKPPAAQEPVAASASSAPDVSGAAQGFSSSVGSTPSVAMPSEWQHHNGEDYDDLFDRMRAGFVFGEVQEPAIDQQLHWFEHNPEYLERTFQRAQRYMYHIVTEVEARGMPLEFALLAAPPVSGNSFRARGCASA
jgi:hypothetical protein